MLNRVGRRAIVLNVPITYPPEEVQGVMVSGVFVPHPAGESVIHPRQRFSELSELLGECTLDLLYTQAWADQDFEGILQEATLTVEGWTRASLHFMSEPGWDLCVVVFTETDRIQHRFWQWLSPEEGSHLSRENGNSRGRREKLLDFYTNLDAHLGKMIAQAGEETYIFILSDHGFGGSKVRRKFYINSWLSSLGLFYPRHQPFRSLIRRIIQKFHPIRPFPDKNESSRQQPGITSRLDMDWERSKVCYIGVESMGLYILREPFGPVGAEEYEPLRKFLKRELLALTDPASRQRLVGNVFKREELYWGECLQEAPDLLFTLRGNQHGVSKSWKRKSRLFRDTRERGEGSHRPEGIMMMKGPGIKENTRLEEAQIIDIAPTLLYVLGVEIPGDMDGKVLLEAFQERHRANHPVRYAESSPKGESTGSMEGESVYSEEELETIQKRLMDLGYL
ncbi:MAG: alkaline phosphatase family protein, partial [Candidatus Tectomicrobia bacterium]|nr:alkaline phosphatase family protein [Candidatus Tectomicrobia bacterium]